MFESLGAQINLEFRCERGKHCENFVSKFRDSKCIDRDMEAEIVVNRKPLDQAESHEVTGRIAKDKSEII